MANRERMDRVKFDATMEIIARLLKQKSDEVIETKKVILKCGLMRFYTTRLIDDLENLIELVKVEASECFVAICTREKDSGEAFTVGSL